MSDSPMNILLITCDQYRFPRFSYGPDGGLVDPIKQILGFQGDISEANPWARHFPALMRLRRHAVVLRNHTIAASACTPSRATLYTGQYGTRTGVTQTDGLFKSGDAAGFPWLAPNGVPTLGHWMREAGYTTHYFGKWHVSNPPDHTLQDYGFDDWEQSYPEPHGASPNNLGLYRDVGFSESAATFLIGQGLGLPTNRAPSAPSKPWFAVVSLTNPHDIATYPGVLAQALPAPSDAEIVPTPDGLTLPPQTQSVFGPLSVPEAGSRAPKPDGGTMRVPLNPTAFPEACAGPVPTSCDDLANKPACQRDYAVKMGLGLASKLGEAAALKLGVGTRAAVAVALRSTIPFCLAPDPEAASLAFLQVYGWLHSLVDASIGRVLDALEQSGQAENTVVIFLADHGELGGAHGGMMEKWHTAYQEVLHVPMVVSSPAINPDLRPRQVDAVTSHIDLLPTVLGLAGVGPLRRRAIAHTLAKTRPVPELPGLDLSRLIRNETQALDREGVLFITDDEITAPLPGSKDTNDLQSLEDFEVFCAAVDAVIAGKYGKGPLPALHRGPVCQPNHIHCVRTPRYKLARYLDPRNATPDEWELYDLERDPNETTNLVQVGVTPPTAVPNPPKWTDEAEVQRAADSLLALLQELEQTQL